MDLLSQSLLALFCFSELIFKLLNGFDIIHFNLHFWKQNIQMLLHVNWESTNTFKSRTLNNYKAYRFHAHPDSIFLLQPFMFNFKNKILCAEFSWELIIVSFASLKKKNILVLELDLPLLHLSSGLEIKLEHTALLLLVSCLIFPTPFLLFCGRIFLVVFVFCFNLERA